MKQFLLFFFLLTIGSCGNTGQPSFEWDFSQPNSFVYSFHQTLKGENKMDTDIPPMQYSAVGDGILTVKVKDNQLADVSLTKLEVAMVYYKEDGTPRDTLQQQAPNIVMQGMQQNGKFEDSSKDILFDILFPLPEKQLQQGGSYELPMKTPFNANGSPLSVTGQNTLTFTGYKEVAGRNCAVLEGIIEVSDLEVPEEIEGEFETTQTGKGSYYFDREQHYYVGADIQLDIFAHSKIATKTAQETFAFDMQLKSSNLYTIRLQEIIKQ